MKTKLLMLSLLAMAAVGFTHANYSTTSSEYVTHDMSSLNFSAIYADGKVSMTRGSFSVPSGQTWQYRKVIKSLKNSNPVYPDDGYIYYGGNLSDDSYVDTNLSAGTNYYRVCAITQGAENRHRYCSSVKVIKVTSTSTSETVTTPEKEKVKTTTATLTATKKAVIDKLVESYMTKLNAKYTTDAQKITQLEKTITAVSAVKTSKLKAMYAYMAEKLNDELEALELSNILQIN